MYLVKFLDTSKPFFHVQNDFTERRDI